MANVRSRTFNEVVAIPEGMATYVLRRALEDRLLSPPIVDGYRAELQHEIAETEARLNLLRSQLGGDPSPHQMPARDMMPVKRRGRPPGAGRAAADSTQLPVRRGRPPGAHSKQLAVRRDSGSVAQVASTVPAQKKPRKAPLTAAAMESRQLQGTYLSLIRRIPADRRPIYQQISTTSGRQEAINAMRKALQP